MTSAVFSINRRTLLGAAAATLTLAAPSGAAGTKSVVLELAPLPDHGPGSGGFFRGIELPRLVMGDSTEILIRNGLQLAVNVGWRGLNGLPELQPWLARPPIAPGAAATFALPLRQAGTFLCEARSAADGSLAAAMPFPVAEASAKSFDLDATLILETLAKRVGDGPPAYLVNRRRTPAELSAPANARLRLRLANVTPAIVAMQAVGLNPVVVALDSQPCEPFPARDARVVLAPGTRIDLAIDALGRSETKYSLTLEDGRRSQTIATLTISAEAPARAAALPLPTALPSNGLPERLALASALRVDLPLDLKADRTLPAQMSATVAPSFTVKRGRTVVLALANPSDRVRLFHLSGHHARLLDKLDDGWKPFWVDTVLVPPRQTVRIAFAAEHVGTYLLETSTPGEDGAPWMRSYRVVT